MGISTVITGRGDDGRSCGYARARTVRYGSAAFTLTEESPTDAVKSEVPFVLAWLEECCADLGHVFLPKSGAAVRLA